MTDEILDVDPDRLVSVIEQMVDLPWPDGEEMLEWEIDGVEGQTTFLTHVLPLAATSDAAALARYTASFARRADRRWGTRHDFDASLFTDDMHTQASEYDRRSAPAGLVRALGAAHAVWWQLGDDAVLLIDSSGEAPRPCKAAVLVLSTQWLHKPGAEEAALAVPLVSDFLSKDTRRVLHAVWEVFKTRDPEVLRPLAKALPAITRATEDLELGGALLSNDDNLEHALERIRLFKDGTCLCAAYPDHPLYEPAKERSYGHVRVVDEIPVFFNGRPDRPRRICECTACGRQFEVEEGEYHYTWWKWRAKKTAR